MEMIYGYGFMINAKEDLVFDSINKICNYCGEHDIDVKMLNVFDNIGNTYFVGKIIRKTTPGEYVSLIQISNNVYLWEDLDLVAEALQDEVPAANNLDYFCFLY
jgi:hypothetical protein